MKNTILLIVTVAVAVLLVAAFFVTSQISELQNQVSDLQSQNSELQDQVSELQDEANELQNQNIVLQNKLHEEPADSPVKITSIKKTGFAPIVGLTMQSFVNVTVQNIGSTNVSGLTLTVRLLNNKTEIGDGYRSRIDNLLAGESRELSGPILYGLNSVFSIEIRVKLGDLVLDEYVRGN